MSSLTREQILSAEDIDIEKVDVRAWWGDYTYVKGMSAAARGKIEASSVEMRGNNPHVNMAQLRERIAAATICDESGILLFTQKDIKALGEKSAAALDVIVEVSNRLSRITQDDVEELTKEFEANPSKDSATD